MQLELKCHPGITSCINEGPVAVDEIVFIYTVAGRYTDEGYQGFVRATVKVAIKDCGCWNYKLELFEEDLPAGIANLSLCDIVNFGCAQVEQIEPVTPLVAPSNLIAEQTCFEGTLELSWQDNSSDETSFEIQRSLDGVSGWITVLTPAANATSDGDTGLVANTQYFYRIRGIRTGPPIVVSEWSSIGSAPTAQHGVPTNLVATVISSDQIDLTWVDNASGETGFEIQRSLDGIGGWVTVLTPAADATSDSDTGLDPGTEYFYRIRATGEGGTFSCWSSDIEVTASGTTEGVAAPSGLTATENGTDTIDLVWIDNSAGETGFEIERSLDGVGGWVQVLTPAAEVEADSDTGLTEGTQYFYRIRAVEGAFVSPWSNIAEDFTLPATPSNLAAGATSDTTIDITWTDESSSETGFEIERSLDGVGGWVLVSVPDANATNDTDTGLTEGTQYFYRIRSVRSGDVSAWSIVFNDFTLPAPPSALVATANGSVQIDLVWVDNSAVETSFEIERSLDGVGGWVQVLTPVANATSDSDTGLDPLTEYFYRIRAVRSGDFSDWSNVDSATTEAPSALLIAHYIGDSFANGATWQDETINGHDLTKSGNPVNVAAFNGTAFDSVEFDNVGDFFTVSGLPAGLFEDDDGECTMLFVFRADESANSWLMFGEESINLDRVMFGYDSTGNFELARRATTTIHTGIVGAGITGFAVAGFRITGTAVRLRRNELQTDDFNNPNGIMNDITAINIGRQSAGAPAWDFDGQIAEILLYQGAMTDSEWDAKFQELGTKYNISVV